MNLELPKTTVIVAGLGRCGTTMMMTMLALAMPSVGEAPDYEDNRVMGEAMPDLRDFKHAAVKVLDLHRIWWFEAMRELPDPKVIWMDRITRQQARSQAKFTEYVTGLKVPYSRLNDLQRQLVNDRRDCFAKLDDLSVLEVSYETALTRPRFIAQQVAEFLWGTSDEDLVNAMAAIVHDRDHLCRPDMDVELAAHARSEGSLS